MYGVFQVRKFTLMPTLFQLPLIMLLLQYCCLFWNPLKVKHIHAIAAIERIIITKMTQVSTTPLKERLHKQKLCSLQG